MSSIEYIGFDHRPKGAAVKRYQAAMVYPAAHPEWKLPTRGSTIVGKKYRVVIEELIVGGPLVNAFQLRKAKVELLPI